MSAPLATIDPLQHLSLPAKLRLAAEILGAYARVRWTLSRRQLPDAVEALRAHGRSSADPLVTPMPMANRYRLADAVTRLLSVLPTDSRCLMRSLVLLVLLERRCIEARFIIGVKTDPAFAAHAWIEHENLALLPSGAGEYAPLTVL